MAETAARLGMKLLVELCLSDHLVSACLASSDFAIVRYQ